MEALANFLSFGYSSFGQTPIQGVKFIPPHSKISWNDNTKKFEEVLLFEKEQHLINLIHSNSSLEEAIELTKNKIKDWEIRNKTDKKILPLSGGFDSRFLLSMIQNKGSIKAFTYGLSDNQSESYEVIHAKLISEKANISWNHIELGGFHKYFHNWNSLYGPTTHAHGMYHFEFYNKIRELEPTTSAFLTGLIGDAWAGSVNIPEIKTPSDLILLGYTHGMNADSSQMVNPPKTNSYAEEYFEKKRDALKNPRMRVIEAMRFKIILLNYLIKVPKEFGFTPYAPFIDQEIALSMLCLPDDLRKNRKWQVEYFKKIGWDLEKITTKASFKNTLNTQAMLRYPVAPLNKKILREIIKEDYVDWINKNLLNSFQSRMRFKISKSLNKARFRGKRFIQPYMPKDEHLKAYFAYLTLYPLEQVIKKREAFLRGES